MPLQCLVTTECLDRLGGATAALGTRSAADDSTGNILSEATTGAGNIFNEAMRHLSGIRKASCAASRNSITWT
jgi:hypothetical protein